MPILGRSPEECFKEFRKHVGQLVAATLDKRSPVSGKQIGDTNFTWSFSDGAAVALSTKAHGKIFVYLSQALTAEKEQNQYRLRTAQYWYRVQATADPKEKADLRWEYNSETKRDVHCRNHAHVNATVALGIGSINFNKIHLPTGWVTFEEVIRFLIHEFGVVPPCGQAWPKRLLASEKAFYEKFTSKRYKSPKG